MGIALRRCADAPYMRRVQYRPPLAYLSIENAITRRAAFIHSCGITGNPEIISTDAIGMLRQLWLRARTTEEQNVTVSVLEFESTQAIIGISEWYEKLDIA